MRLSLSHLCIGFLTFATMGAESLRTPLWQLATYSNGGFDLYRVGIKEPQHLGVGRSAGGYSTAPNGRFLVYASKDGRHGMGHIYRLDTTTGKELKLTADPFYFGQLETSEAELYSEPEISPDSRSIAFAVHRVSNNDSDDLVGLSGPIAVMDLESGNARVLETTRNIDGQGPCFANTLRWSPDGKRILFACEVTGGIASADGKGLHRLDDQLRGPVGKEGDALPVGWLSDDEILYVWNAGDQVAGVGELFVLNLHSNKSVPAAPRLRLTRALLENLVSLDLTKQFLVINRVDKSEILARAGKLPRDFPSSVAGAARLRADIH